MNVILQLDRRVLGLAGTLVLGGSLLGYWLSPWWLVLPLLVGCNLIATALTGICPAMVLMSKCGVHTACAGSPTLKPGK
jgi:hypothetical protein